MDGRALRRKSDGGRQARRLLESATALHAKARALEHLGTAPGTSSIQSFRRHPAAFPESFIAWRVLAGDPHFFEWGRPHGFLKAFGLAQQWDIRPPRARIHATVS